MKIKKTANLLLLHSLCFLIYFVCRSCVGVTHGIWPFIQGPSWVLWSEKVQTQFKCRSWQCNTHSCKPQDTWAIKDTSETPQPAPADGRGVLKAAPHLCAVTRPGRTGMECFPLLQPLGILPVPVHDQPCLEQQTSCQRAWAAHLPLSLAMLWG